jgi:zinc ribbon protein
VAVCSNCNTRNADNSPYCRNCGRSLQSRGGAPSRAVYPPPVSQQRKRSSPGPILAAVVAGVVIVGIFCTVFVTSAMKRAEARERAEENTKAIQAVLGQDRELSDHMNTEVGQIKVQSEEDVNKMAQVVKSYVEQAREIDTTTCPREFAEAYSKHIAAWSDAAATLRSHPHVPSGGEALVDVLTVLFTDDKSSVDKLQNEASDWKQELDEKHELIQKTWTDVNTVAKRYGAS